MQRAVAIAGCIVAAATIAGCESTQTKSARLAKNGNGRAGLSKVSGGATNTAIKVGATKLLASNGLHAAVVELDNEGPTAQVGVPLLIDVKDAKGASVYRNDIQGLQPSLQQMAFLETSKKAYWVNDQVLATDPKSLTVEVGKAKGTPPAKSPRIVVSATKLGSDSTGVFASGVVANESKIVQRNLPVFAVGLKDGQIVAAGRALIPRLDPQPTKKPTTFRIFFVGDPKGAQLRFTAVPTAVTEGAS